VRSPIAAVLIAILASPAVHSAAEQKPAEDIAALYAEGKASGTEYKNEYFGVTVNVASGEFT
jgi:hypothetical protein